MKGIVYKYTMPNGKVYIGQTIDEERRRRDFLNINKRYAGNVINNARKKYGPENIKYEKLFEGDFKNIEDANDVLNQMEKYYIQVYNSKDNGYNMTYGGDGVRGLIKNADSIEQMRLKLKEYYKTHDNPFKGRKHTEETKEKLRQIAMNRESAFKGKKHTEESKIKMSVSKKGRFIGEKNAFYGKKHTAESKAKISEKNGKPVAQIDVETNEIIKIYASPTMASKELNKKRGNVEISKVCTNYITPSGKRYLTAHGYKWKYLSDIEGSTTTEMDGKTYYRPK